MAAPEMRAKPWHWPTRWMPMAASWHCDPVCSPAGLPRANGHFCPHRSAPPFAPNAKRHPPSQSAADARPRAAAHGQPAAGFVAVGVPEAVAFSAALCYRMCTFYLPPIWGWFAFNSLRKDGYL